MAKIDPTLGGKSFLTDNFVLGVFIFFIVLFIISKINNKEKLDVAEDIGSFIFWFIILLAVLFIISIPIAFLS
jgi:hypothetical protein